MLFNEPKLLKSGHESDEGITGVGFSALQRAEIAEMRTVRFVLESGLSFSALQRAEIAEMLRAAVEQFAEYLFQCSSTSRNC